MSAPAWNGPPVGVMRPGMLAVSGARPPNPAFDVRAEWRLFDGILADVGRVIGALHGFRVVHGGAEGVDFESSHASRFNGEQHLPDYKRHGPGAPMIRNAYVTTTERFIAWPAPWSKGTWDAVQKRLKACGNAGFELRLVGWGKGGDGVPEGIREALDKVGATWTEVSL